ERAVAAAEVLDQQAAGGGRDGGVATRDPAVVGPYRRVAPAAHVEGRVHAPRLGGTILPAREQRHQAGPARAGARAFAPPGPPAGLRPRSRRRAVDGAAARDMERVTRQNRAIFYEATGVSRETRCID